MDHDETETRSEVMANTLPVAHYLDRLRERRDDLIERYGIASLGVFGSYIRNEQREGSDLDILVSFTKAPGLFKLVELQDELSELLGAPVDLVVRSELKPHIGQRILAEVVEV
jgi:predicted nucleotidyltransferase